ncbi:MAG: hypothetical protein GXY84_07725 [Clostridiales bacterium]|nr:hypothetical protein [Clostridiales bacterium]
MNSYRFRPKPSFQTYGTRQQRLVMLVIILLLVGALVFVGSLYLNASSQTRKVTAQLQSRANSNLVDAIGHVSRMAGGVQSNSPIKLGQIRQHIYAMDQINTISIGMRGEGGRIIPQDAIQALYSVLERYEVAVQTATGNTLELRTLLLTHLMSLQELMDTNR